MMNITERVTTCIVTEESKDVSESVFDIPVIIFMICILLKKLNAKIK